MKVYLIKEDDDILKVFTNESKAKETIRRLIEKEDVWRYNRDSQVISCIKCEESKYVDTKDCLKVCIKSDRYGLYCENQECDQYEQDNTYYELIEFDVEE